MKTYFIVFLCCFFLNGLLGNFALAGASDKKSIAVLFDTYMQNYNNHLQGKSDLADYGIYSDTMMVGTPAGGAKHWVLDDFKAASKRFVMSLKEQKVASIEWDKVNIKLLSETGAVASVRTIRRDENGNQIGEFGSATYLLAKSEAGWRIMSFLVHDADTMLEF